MSRPLSPLRVQAQAQAAALYHEAISAAVASGDGSATYRAIAERLAMGKTEVERLTDPASGHAITVRDLLAGPRSVAREAFLRGLAAVELLAGPDLQQTHAELVIALGKAHEALVRDLAPDGRIDDHAAHRGHLLRIAGLALRGAFAAGGRP